MKVRWRWIFPSRWLASVAPYFDFSALRKIPAGLFSLVFPDDCRVCGRPLLNISRIPVCAACLLDPKPMVAEFFCASCHAPFLNAAPLDASGRCGLCSSGLTEFDSAVSFGEYGGTLRTLIHLYKYTGVHPLSHPLGRMMASAVPSGQTFDMVVPMPLHWFRYWKRGFNQSELLARVVAKRLRIPVRNAVRRKRSTPAQAGLSSAQRRTNVAGAFRAARRCPVQDRHVLLVDDVLTTGASVNACAAVLKRAGARRVTVLTLARADRRQAGFRNVT